MASCKAEDDQLQTKELFFNKLQSLNESSDEEDTNNIHEIIRKCRKPSAALQPAVQRIQTPSASKRIPALQRATSAPASIIKETPPVPPHRSLLRQNTRTPSTSFDITVIKETPTLTPRPQEHRTLSTPSIGTDLILNYSTGIESMLGKKSAPKGQKRKKRKEASINLVSESERLFKDFTFYYIPPNDIAPLRRARVKKAREFGVTWPRKEWNADTITHVVVDRGITYEDVMNHLKQFKLEILPPNIILVNEEYPIHCITHKLLVDPSQEFYEVPRQGVPPTEETTMPRVSQTSDRSLVINDLKSRSKKGPIHPNETPPRSQQRSTQHSPLGDNQQIRVHTAEPWLGQHGASMVDSPLGESDVEDGPKKRQQFTFGDELDQIIDIQRGMQHLPFDEEEDDEGSSRPGSRDSPEETDSEDERPQSRSSTSESKRKGKWGSFNQETYTCMTGGDGVTGDFNPNKYTIEILQQMCDYYERTRDHWRQTAYKKVISTLKKQKIKISTYEQAIELPSIGDRLAKKIEEIVMTGHLRRLESAQAEPTDKYLQTFLNIYGVGIAQAGKWVQQGHRTLDDLLSKAKLTDNQKLGIDRYDDFLTRIPRDEVAALGEVVNEAAANIDPNVQLIIGGSFRRGATTSGDIDCLLTKPGTNESRDLLPFVNELVRVLTSTGILVAALATPSEGGSASKWHGCCVLPRFSSSPIWRRIDFLMVPETEIGAALIYFTGDDIFNRSLRLLASRKGWRLNQRGLYRDVLRGPGRAKLNEGSLMEGANEKKIFEILGVPWRPPEHRICH